MSNPLIDASAIFPIGTKKGTPVMIGCAPYIVCDELPDCPCSQWDCKQWKLYDEDMEPTQDACKARYVELPIQHFCCWSGVVTIDAVNPVFPGQGLYLAETLQNGVTTLSNDPAAGPRWGMVTGFRGGGTGTYDNVGWENPLSMGATGTGQVCVTMLPPCCKCMEEQAGTNPFEVNDAAKFCDAVTEAFPSTTFRFGVYRYAGGTFSGRINFYMQGFALSNVLTTLGAPASSIEQYSAFSYGNYASAGGTLFAQGSNSVNDPPLHNHAGAQTYPKSNCLGGGDALASQSAYHYAYYEKPQSFPIFAELTVSGLVTIDGDTQRICLTVKHQWGEGDLPSTGGTITWTDKTIADVDCSICETPKCP